MQLENKHAFDQQGQVIYAEELGEQRHMRPIHAAHAIGAGIEDKARGTVIGCLDRGIFCFAFDACAEVKQPDQFPVAAVLSAVSWPSASAMRSTNTVPQSVRSSAMASHTSIENGAAA